ncbi:MAG: hypothetical protein HUU34_19640 [Saprospiraceae bacterium]|jgi:hypothetical protein|nr:hypothetical protein [Saprospiraceae bacterium]
METIKQLNKFTKTILIAGLTFILYGYLCRLIGLYFFWESKSIGWALLFIGVIGFLFHRINIKKREKKKTLFEKIGIGIIIFILLVQTIFIAVIPLTDAYSVAKAYLINDANLKTKIGNITGFGLIPSGSIQKTTDSSGEYGSAIINLTVKGDKKFKDITIYVAKNADSPDWKVEGIK